MQGAAEHVKERIRNTRLSARRSGVPAKPVGFVGWRWRRRRWGAWAPKHRGGFSAALLEVILRPAPAAGVDRDPLRGRARRLREELREHVRRDLPQELELLIARLVEQELVDAG